MYRVEWKINGVSDCGSWLSDLAAVTAWVAHGNAQHGNGTHWLGVAP